MLHIMSVPKVFVDLYLFTYHVTGGVQVLLEMDPDERVCDPHDDPAAEDHAEEEVDDRIGQHQSHVGRHALVPALLHVDLQLPEGEDGARQ